MNKTEAAYAELLKLRQLDGQIRWWAYEPIKLRLADVTFYTPDFLVQWKGVGGSRLQFIEVKGFWRDDARVKIKVAAELFPMFDFLAVRRDGNGWETEEF